MKKKLVFVVLLVVLTTASALWFISQKNRSNGAEYLDLIQTVEDSASPEPARIRALIRLAQLGSPKASKVALEWLELDSQTLRQGAYGALAELGDGEIMPVARERFMNESFATQARVVELLGARLTAERTDFLRGLAEDQTLDPEVRVLASIHSASNEVDAGDRVRHLMSEVDRLPDTARLRAFNSVLRLWPEDRHLISEVRRRVFESKQGDLVAAGVRHLGAVKDEWLGQNLSFFLNHAHPDVRAAAVSSVHFVCPKNRWQLLGELAKRESNDQVIARLIDEPAMMKGQEAKIFLSSLPKGIRESSQWGDRINESLAAQEKPPLTDMCASRRGSQSDTDSE